jgi:hypothetical protein
MSMQFVSVVREGLATKISVPDTGPGSTALAGTSLQSTLGFSVAAKVSGAYSQEVPMRMVGPDHADGIDHGIVLRTDPPRGAQFVDTTLFPQVEFDPPGLPWMLTPLAPNNKQLRPWIALVVLPVAGEHEPLDTRPEQLGRLPVLTVQALSDLPPIEETWAWAHAQYVTGTSSAASATELTGLEDAHQAATLSRLLFPKRLEIGRHYVACVVPTFEAARCAGLKEAADATVDAAWGPNATFPLRLPVYYHWEFFAGDAGNFEEAVRRLRRTDPPAEAGRLLDASKPGRTVVEDPAADQLPLAGALRPDVLKITDYNGPAVAGYEQLARTGEVVSATGGQKYPVVNVPLYAGKHVGATNAASAPDWVRTLNTDPRNRLAAGLGAAIVRKNQEDLMKSAWDQVGKVEEANRRLRRAKLGRQTTARIVDRHIKPLDAVTQLGLLAPAFERMAIPQTDRTLRGLVGESGMPAILLSAPFTALTRPGGRLGRRLATPGTVPGVVTGVDDGTFTGDRGELGRPGGLVTVEGVMAVIDAARTSVNAGGDRTPVDLGSVQPTIPGRLSVSARAVGDRGRATSIGVSDPAGAVGGTPGPALTMGGVFALAPAATTARVEPIELKPAGIDRLPGTVEMVVGNATLDLTESHKAALKELLAPLEPVDTSPAPPLGIDDVARSAMTAIDPEKSIPQFVLSRLELPSQPAGDDALDEVLACPVFPAALATDLIAIAPDMLLPGLEEVKPDHVFAVVSNNPFVQSVLAGANYEIMRELRWRGYPTDERGTSFRRFWSPDEDEIPELHTIKTGKLGGAVSNGASDVVVVIRSDLLRRFPGTQLFAVPADTSGTKPKPDFSKPELPSFRGRISDDVSYFGFAFTEQTAKGSPGRYLVFQEPLTAPSFGLDTPSPATSFPANASDLSWSNVPTSEGFVRVAGSGLGPWQTFGDRAAKWGDSAAGQAVSTLQRPVRAAVHFRDLLGAP